jgi:hypothetical protein
MVIEFLKYIKLYIERTSSVRRRRMFLALSVMFNLSGFGMMPAWGNVSTTQPSESWELFLKDENLTAHIHGIPLKLVLERFQKTTSIATVINGNMEDRLVKADFENLPLEKGLQQLLKGHQFILTFGNSVSPNGHSTHKIEALHVYPPLPAPESASQNPLVTALAEATPPSNPGKLERTANPVLSHEDQGEKPQTHEPDLANMTDEELKELASQSEDPDLLLEALDELLDRGRVADALPFLKSSLKNPDPLIRESALDLLYDMEHPPVGLIADVARYDPSPDLRLDALDQLTDVLEFGNNPAFTLSALQNVALGDKNAEVRLEAMEILVDHVVDAEPNPTQAPQQASQLKQILQQALNNANNHEIHQETKDLLEELQDVSFTAS